MQLMAHHAYYVAGDLEAGKAAALSFVERELGLAPQGNPDVMQLSYGLLSVDDARHFGELAYRMPAIGTQKALIASASRFFHEAQNALLKVFEEPPAGTTLILVLPSEGILLPTLRSRLLPLPREGSTAPIESDAQAFLEASDAERKKLVEKLLDRTKSDKDEEKQAARLAALRLAEGLLHAAYEARKGGDTSEEVVAFLDDLDCFIPMLHDRAAPLKQIFEHLLLVIPPSLTK